MKVINAKFAGRCRGCGQRFAAGERVWIVRGGYWHPECLDIQTKRDRAIEERYGLFDPPVEYRLAVAAQL